MKVGIHNEPAEGGIGGSEVSVAVLAEALARQHEVEIVHHKPTMNAARLAEISGTVLTGVRMRFAPVDAYSFGRTHNPLQRYKAAREWQATLSAPYDLFINFTHGFPPFCHADAGALVVLFPVHAGPPFDAEGTGSEAKSVSRWNRIKALYHEWEWKKRLDSYQIKTTISRFSQSWTRQRWGVDCEIVYP